MTPLSWIWVIFAGICVVMEIFTAGFVLLWFGVGAVCAAIMAWMGFRVVYQILVFTVVSGVLFAVSRKFAEKFSAKQPPGIGADRFAGQTGVVFEEIDNLKNTGRVRILQDEWRADSVDGSVIPVDAIIEVIKMDGTHAVVKIKQEGV